MPREVSEWEGKTDDTALPPRVKIRIFDRCRGNAIAASDHRFALKFVESVALGVIKNGSKP